MKRRLLRLLGIGLVLLLFTGYFAFSTFLFSPIEGGYEPDVSTLVPRDVDFFVAKAGLARDFDRLPRLAEGDRLEASRAGRVFLASPEYAELADGVGLAELEREIADGLSQLPTCIDPLSAFGGRDLALAGYLGGAELADSAWAVYGRVDWKGKLAASLLRHPGWLGVEEQGVAIERVDDVFRITAPDLPWPQLFVARLRDVVLVTNDARFAPELFELEGLSGQDSLGQSAVYRDSIVAAERSGEELEVFVEFDRFGEALGWGRGWPDPASDVVWEALLARVLQPRLVREVAGTLGFENGVQLDLQGGLISDRFTTFQKVAFRQGQFDRQELTENLGRLAPADCGLALFARTDLGGLLGEYTKVMEPALRSNLVDGILRPVFGYAGVEELVARLDGIFGPRIAVLVRRNDYPKLPGDPPNDGSATPAWAIVLWIDRPDDLEELQRSVIQNQSRFGLQGPEPGSPGVYTNQLRSGAVAHEYWSLAVPGTGHLATVREGDLFVLSNHYELAGDVVDTRYGREGHPQLARRGEFNALLSTGLQSMSFAAWFDPRALGKDLRSLSMQEAQAGAFDDFDVVGRRRQVDAQLLAEEYPGRTADSLTESELVRLDELAEAEMDRIRADLREQRVPELYAQSERAIVYAESIRAGLLQLALDPRRFALSLRLVVPLEESLPQ